MFEIDENESLDISSEIVVVDSTLPSTASLSELVSIRVDLGSSDKPIQGSGEYTLKIFVNTVRISPDSTIAVGDVDYTILQSRSLVLVPGDNLQVSVIGTSGDTDVYSKATVVGISNIDSDSIAASVTSAATEAVNEAIANLNVTVEQDPDRVILGPCEKQVVRPSWE